eukprot:1161249-Pelagomonas_calceolata.AAC.3
MPHSWASQVCVKAMWFWASQTSIGALLLFWGICPLARPFGISLAVLDMPHSLASQGDVQLRLRLWSTLRQMKKETIALTAFSPCNLSALHYYPT